MSTLDRVAGVEQVDATSWAWLNEPVTTTFYERIGSEEGVRCVADRFYDVIEESYPTLRAMLPASTEVTRKKFFKYLSGWLGGPQLYIAEYGHPRLRMRHFPFEITSTGVNDWLEAMDRTLRECDVEEGLIDELMALFGPLALHMQNQPESD